MLSILEVLIGGKLGQQRWWGKIKGFREEIRLTLVLKQWFGLDWYKLAGWILLLRGVDVSESRGDTVPTALSMVEVGQRMTEG